MELEKIKNLIIDYANELNYIPEEFPDIITIKIGNENDDQSENNSHEKIFVEIIMQANETQKNIIVFSGIGTPFNPLLEDEKLKAISLLRGNTTMRANGYWGIQYSYGTYWTTYFVDIFEDGLNKETFDASILAILSAKRNYESIIKKPYHIN